MARPIALDADAISAIGNGGITFSVSGRVISGATLPLKFGPSEPSEFVFGLTGGFSEVLRITTVPGPIAGAGLPGLILSSAGLLGWWRRRQNLCVQWEPGQAPRLQKFWSPPQGLWYLSEG
jgi:hypothetical protein